MKNPLNKKKVIGYTGKGSVLSKSFIKKYSDDFIFKKYRYDINDLGAFQKWIDNHKNINILINFAAITSTIRCNKNKKLALITNYSSPKEILKIINNSKLKNFSYFLSVSSCHVFKKSFKRLNENSKKIPESYYGKTKLRLENYIDNNRKKFYFKIGVARIFNYFNHSFKKGFFINDIIIKLKNNDDEIKFRNINTVRDFISMNEINTALYKMIEIEFDKDVNICSGKQTFLPDIINYLNKKIKNKKIFFDSKKIPGFLGSNLRLKKIGWKNNSKYNLTRELFRYKMYLKKVFEY